MALGHKIKSLFNRKEKKITTMQQAIEDEFNKGNIILPTHLIDYEDLAEFKDKTSHLQSIKKKISIIEKDGK